MTDRIAQASVELVTERARKLVNDGGSRVLVLRAKPRWTGPDQLTVGDTQVLVRPAVSQLAALDALADLAQRGPTDRLIILTDRQGADLGDAVLVRADRNRVEELDEWEAVPSLFAAHALDPALRRAGGWVPAALLQHQPAGGWPPAPSGVVTLDHALGNLVGALIRLPLPAQLDLLALVTALDVPSTRALWQATDPSLRASLTGWVSTRVGPAAAMAMSIAARGRVAVSAVGLALDVLWPGDGAAPINGEQAAARARIESRIDDQPVSPGAARQLARASRSLVLRLEEQNDPSVSTLLLQAEALLADVGWATGAEHSGVLTAGLVAREHHLADELTDDVTALASRMPQIEGALRDLADHDLARSHTEPLYSARMAVRLCRRVAATSEPSDRNDRRSGASGLRDALQRYLDDGCWVDRAASTLWSSSTDDRVSTGYRKLLTAVRRLRNDEDRTAAQLLAEVTAHDEPVPGVSFIESVLRDEIWPVAKSLRPLLILLDGMSAPVAAQLAEAAAGAGWSELVPAVSGRRRPVLAALPTLTRYSRTAFFAGELRDGGQDAEKAAMKSRFKAPLFHKDDLRAPAGEALPSAVRDAINGDAVMVGVVLNTIDDALARHDPGGTRWDLADIQHLKVLLDAAAIAGRAVVLTSDHGHVVERGGEARQVSGAEARCRPASTGAATDGEVLVRGRRVVPGDVVLPWREDLRYGALRSGYHGGASLAEITVPFVLLVRGDQRAEGWVPAPPQAPEWWNEGWSGKPRAAKHRAGRAASTPSGASQVEESLAKQLSDVSTPSAAETGGQEVLGFDVPIDVRSQPQSPSRAPELVSRLLASEVYADQRRRAGRRALSDEQVSGALTTLIERDGRAHRDTVAAALGVPAGSFASLQAALARLLNVEGYQVVRLDPDGVTLRLDEALLREQFELGDLRG